ncbi:MAG TPA: DUF4129 domain-containing protein [Anaerolineae bacterium]|nr:DUF4129 domain-containing protein [Anaerolineae bacterium]
MSDLQTHESFHLNERVSIFASHLSVSAMIACLAASVVQFGQRVVSTFNGDYLLPVCFLVALEAAYTQRGTQGMDFPSRRWAVYRLTEWVVILVTLKVIVLLAREATAGTALLGADLSPVQRAWLTLLQSVNQLGIDLLQGSGNFLSTFFSGEYVVALIVVWVAWFLAGQFAGDLMGLEGGDEALSFERTAYPTSDRLAARQNLIRRIFVLGAALLLLVGLLRIDLGMLRIDAPAARLTLTSLLIYFVLGFILLSQSRWIVLRSQWKMEGTPIGRDLAARWIVYSLLFLIGLGVLASLLPTAYALGFLGTLGTLISLLLNIISAVAILIFTLLHYLLSSVLRLLQGQTTPDESPPFELPALMPPGPQAPTSWLDLLKSVIFWSVFISVIIYAFSQYLRLHPEIGAALRRLAGWRWLAPIWRWLRGLLHGLRRGIGQVLGPTGLLSRLASKSSTPTPRIQRPLRLSPRQRVLFFYLAMVRRGGEAGITRQTAQTPYEYAAVLRADRPEAQDEIDSLTEEFIQARYSRHPVSPADVSRARRYWNRIKQALRRVRLPAGERTK